MGESVVLLQNSRARYLQVIAAVVPELDIITGRTLAIKGTTADLEATGQTVDAASQICVSASYVDRTATIEIVQHALTA